MTMTISGTSGITFPSTAVQGDSAVGYGQTWQNLTASRAYNTTYTNSTGKSIFIMVICANAQPATLYVNSLYAGYTPTNSSLYAIVPNGATYRCDCSYTLNNWSELR